MAIRSVATTDTLDTSRTTFNSLASTDLGDAATLTTTASTIVGAVNEVNAAVAGDMVQIQTFGNRYNADGSNAYTQFTVTVDTKARIFFTTDHGMATGDRIYVTFDGLYGYIRDATNTNHPVDPRTSDQIKAVSEISNIKKTKQIL